MRHRRLAAVVLGAAVLGATVPAVRNAFASAPHDAFLPDFTGTVPGPQTIDNLWAFQVSTGGVQGGQQVTLSFLYNGKHPDKAHAVTFTELDPANIAQNNYVQVLTLPGPPAGVPLQPIAKGCDVGQRGSDVNPHAVQVDPYAQTITITMQGAEPANTILFFCFGGGGLVGFPTDSDSGYSIRYSESGNGSTETPPYKVQPQSTTNTTVAQVVDPDGSDRTDAGLGGSSLAVYGTHYQLNVIGATPGGIYAISAVAFDASTQIQDPSAKFIVQEKGPGCTLPQANQLCDPGTGVATGLVTMQSSSGRPDYVAVTINPTTGASDPSNPSSTIKSLISITAGPANAAPPSAQATPTPLPVGVSAAPTPAFDAACPVGHVFPAHGVGSRDVLDAAARVLIPDADASCPDLSSKLNFVGADDEVGMAKTLNCSTVYAYAGIDRSLTTQEESNYSSNACLGGGMQQFPILVEPVVVTYNLDAPGCNAGQVNLRSPILSAIFAGVITQWSDAKLVNPDNPGLAHCNLPILVAHDNGPATLTFKDYLSKRTGLWNAYKQPQMTGVWPGLAQVACTANGSEAMALCVEGKPGMIGYGYYRYITAAGLPVAAVDDASLTFQSAPLDPATGCTAAAQNNPAVPNTTDSQSWSNAPTITDTPQAYPICSFDFLIAPDKCDRAIFSYLGFKAFLGAVYTDATQKDLVAHGFAPLPASVIKTAQSGYSGTTSTLQC